jgi:hypothetical protein
MSTDPLQEAFERFLIDRDESALLAAVHRHGGRAPSRELDSPVAHRICDVQLGGSGYRVVRVFDPDDRSTKVFIYPTDSPAYTALGVPLALQGGALQRWIEDELKSPTRGPVRWSSYDPLLRDDG